MQMMLLDNGMQAKYLVFFLSTLALMTSNGRLCMIWVQFAYLESQTVPRQDRRKITDNPVSSLVVGDEQLDRPNIQPMHGILSCMCCIIHLGFIINITAYHLDGYEPSVSWRTLSITLGITPMHHSWDKSHLKSRK